MGRLFGDSEEGTPCTLFCGGYSVEALWLPEEGNNALILDEYCAQQYGETIMQARGNSTKDPGYQAYNERRQIEQEAHASEIGKEVATGVGTGVGTPSTSRSWISGIQQNSKIPEKRKGKTMPKGATATKEKATRAPREAKSPEFVEVPAGSILCKSINGKTAYATSLKGTKVEHYSISGPQKALVFTKPTTIEDNGWMAMDAPAAEPVKAKGKTAEAATVVVTEPVEAAELEEELEEESEEELTEELV
jgi:hypothetical protein